MAGLASEAHSLAVQFCAEHGLQDELAWPLRTVAFSGEMTKTIGDLYSGEMTKTIGDLYSKYARWLMNDDDPFLEDLVFFL